MQPGIFTATALADGAPVWAPRAASRHGAIGVRPTVDHPEVARRVAAGTRFSVHTTPAYGGHWWQVQGGPSDGLIIRHHDPAWSVNG